MPTSLDAKYTDLLRSKRIRVTSQRLQLLRVVADRGPLSIADLCRNTSHSMDRVTVYRIVELYERAGLLRRNWNGFRSTVELGELMTPHHHHAYCRMCQKHIPIHSAEIEAAIANLARDIGFVADEHAVELYGMCATCQSAC